jgi:hypothetical protein
MRRALLLVAFAFALGGCGGGSGKQSEKPECPSTTTEEQASTTTVDPRCLTGAQGTSQPTTSQAKGELWKGPVTGHGTYPGCSPAEPAVAGEVELSVDDNGVVTGHATEDIASYECGGVPTDLLPIPGRSPAAKRAKHFNCRSKAVPCAWISTMGNVRARRSTRWAPEAMGQRSSTPSSAPAAGSASSSGHL